MWVSAVILVDVAPSGAESCSFVTSTVFLCHKLGRIPQVSSCTSKTAYLHYTKLFVDMFVLVTKVKDENTPPSPNENRNPCCLSGADTCMYLVCVCFFMHLPSKTTCPLESLG